MSGSEVLVPYGEFDIIDLAEQLSAVVKVSKELLVARNLLGPIARYGAGIDLAKEKVRKGQLETNPGHFAVVNEAGNVVGAASVYRNDDEFGLHKLRLPIPPILARGPLAVEYPYANPNVAAWVTAGEESNLASAYRQLVRKAIGYEGVSLRPSYQAFVDERPRPWALEPRRSPVPVHEAIAASGLTKIERRRFDAGESRVKIPPRETFYAKLWSEWSTSHGKRKELKTGQVSFLTSLDRYGAEEM